MSWRSWRIRLTETRLCLLVSAVLTVLYLSLAETAPLRIVEGYLLDSRFQLRGAESPGTDVALVLIDDKSVDELGRWPWSRRLYATAVDKLHRSGARVIAFDLLFSEAESGDPADGSADRRAPDRRFSQTIGQAGDVLVPFAFVLGKASHVTAAPPGQVSEVAATSAYRTFRNPPSGALAMAPSAQGVLLPLREIGNAATAMGHVNVALDADGTARYEYPVVRYGDAYFPSLAVQAARAFLGFTLEEVAVEFGSGVRLGARRIPTDESMRMTVNFYGPNGTFPSYSFTDLIHDRVPDSDLDGKLVVIGASAVGIGDRVVSPFSGGLSGSERIATVIANILGRDFVVRQNAFWLLDAAIAILCGLVLGLIGARLSANAYSLFALALCVVVAGGNLLAFTHANLWLNATLPLAVVVFTFTAAALYRYRTRERQERRTREAFGHYLHPAMVAAVCENADMLKLGGEKRELTVLFSDIRDFTALSERLSPEELVGCINEYFTAMTEIVFANSGLLDKYMGDGLMSVFGAPLPSDEHASQACRTALQMVDAAKTLHEQWARRGLPALRIGVGINSGSMFIGNFGSDFHFDYTVMGNDVNVASRLEQANKTHGTRIIMGDRTRALIGDRFATRELDLCLVRGRREPVRIFELMSAAPADARQVELIGLFERGLDAYRGQRWSEAIGLFEQCRRLVPGDPPSELFIRRCRELGTRSLPEDWDGVVPGPVPEMAGADGPGPGGA